MAKGIEIGIGSDTKAFKQGIEVGVVAPIENAVETLEKLGASTAADDAARSLDKAGDAADDLGKSDGPNQLERALADAQDASKRLERETTDTARAIDDEFRTTYRNLKRNSDDGVNGARAGLSDLKAESGAVARETAASFDGSAASIADAFQEAAANSFTGFGPAGAAAGAAAAIGIGIAGAAMEENARKAEEMKEATVNAFDRMIEAGGDYYTKDAENAAIADALKDPEKAKEILDLARLTGLAEGEAARAVALTGRERDKAIDKLKDVYDANNELIMQGTGFTEQYSTENGLLSDIIEKLRERNKTDKDAIDLLKVYDDATGGTLAKRQEENEVIRARNKALADTPKTSTVKLKIDDSELEQALRKKRSLKLTADVYFRAGNKAI